MRALITGASSGLGEEFAYQLADMGYDLILVARRKDNLLKIKDKIKTDVTIIPLDLSDQDNVIGLYKEVKDLDIDLVINNAGFGLFGEFTETDLDRELKMIDVNIKCVHILTKLFLKDFVKKDKGCILNVASSAAFMSGPKLSTYYASKNYVCRLTEAIYEELRRKGSNVSISALCPGPVDTEFNDVAKGTFHTKALTAPYVVRYALKMTFKKKLIIVPSLKMKLALFLNNLIPRKLSYKIIYNIQDKKMKK